MGSQHPSDIQSPKPAGWQELLGLQYSQLFFSHVLHPLWPWTLHFRQRVLNHIPLHRTALARLLLPLQLWQSDGKSPAVFCCREVLLCPRPSSAAPRNGPTERGLQGCTFNPHLHSISTSESKPLCCCCCCCFSSGHPPIHCYAQPELKDRLGQGLFLCHKGQMLRLTRGLRAALPGDHSGFK